MVLFWSQGYDATSVGDLASEMGLGRQSVYNEFGDKHALYVAAVRHYGQTVTQRAIDMLRSSGSPLGNIRRWFHRLAESSARAPRRGCLLTNTVVELAPRDRQVAALVAAHLGRVEQALHEALNRAVEMGELETAVETDSLASFLLNTAQGVLVLGKAGASRSKLRTIVDVALSLLETA